MQPREIQRISFGPVGSGTSKGSKGRSSPVITASTPFNSSALEVLIFLISAWACGLRNTLPQTMPGMVKSAAYCADPVTLSMPSGRGVLWPIHLFLSDMSFIFNFPCPQWSLIWHLLGVSLCAENTYEVRTARQVGISQTWPDHSRRGHRKARRLMAL